MVRKLRELMGILILPIQYLTKVIYKISSIKYRKLLKKNSVLKDSFAGKRCFVAGSGSSLNNLDTSLLENEIVIGINAGYLKEDVAKAKTKMWIIIDYFFLNPLPVEAIRAIEEHVGDAIYFIPVQAKKYCKKYHLFVDKKVHYLYFSSTINSRYLPKEASLLNLDSAIYKPVGSAETAIVCASFLGIKDIILIGTDSDWFARLTDEQRHFFKESENKHSIDNIIPKDWINHDMMESKLYYGYLLYRAYRLLNDILLNQGIVVRNASGGGLLDVFPLVRYRSLFENKD